MAPRLLEINRIFFEKVLLAVLEAVEGHDRTLVVIGVFQFSVEHLFRAVAVVVYRPAVRNVLQFQFFERRKEIERVNFFRTGIGRRVFLVQIVGCGKVEFVGVLAVESCRGGVIFVRFENAVLNVVEERVAVHVFEFGFSAALSQSENEGEGSAGIVGSLDIESILLPAVVVGNARGVDVVHEQRVLRGAAHGVGEGNVGAARRVVSRHFVSVIIGHAVGLDPDGNFRGGIRLQSDGSGRILRGGASLFAVGTVVVEH